MLRVQPQRHQDQAKRVSAVGTGERVLGTAKIGQRDLQLAHLRPHNVVAMCQHALDCLIDILANSGALLREINKGQRLAYHRLVHGAPISSS